MNLIYPNIYKKPSNFYATLYKNGRLTLNTDATKLFTEANNPFYRIAQDGITENVYLVPSATNDHSFKPTMEGKRLRFTATHVFNNMGVDFKTAAKTYAVSQIEDEGVAMFQLVKV